MKPIDRMNAILAGEAPDRRPFVPSVYEHGAALLDKTPSEVAGDAHLVAQAAIEAYRVYQHDVVTVGIDIYNVEAEAFGCEVRYHESGPSIPGIVSHPFGGAQASEGASIPIPQPSDENRLGLIRDACTSVEDAVGDEVWVYGCMGGPFSQAVELRGFNDIILDIVTNPDAVHGLMSRTTELAVEQARRLSETGVGVYLYESWATMPLIGPDIFADFVVPYNRRVIAEIRKDFNTPPPAIIMGGDITLLIDFFLAADSGLVVCDFNADFDLIRSRISDARMMVRGCVDPKLIERGAWDDLAPSVNTLARKSSGMKNFLWGCGCVPYHTPPEHMLEFKRMCLDA